MPKIENIPAGAYDPDDLPEVDEKTLEKAVAEARKNLNRIRKARGKVRAETPRAGVLDALAETEEDLQAAITGLEEAERRLGRFHRGASVGRVVSVGTAKSEER